ncbi:hypothetical protein CAOG_006483 [Capsaspora owczarzaki ATCC 30864]|uniref:Uncharacterized protein n=1 Tax=Capsaspora owczarzaki (strain ATCC 30864) TaxID=595528 RepID=A0A0D2X4I4_CAPO3|nr:hypothetical protein CAOG_006483 [Capsaspora owczarzaki ATCC 30864]
MGGGARFEFPRYVWSPTGGWWPEPKMWKRNTLLAGAFIVAACIPVYNLSKRLEASVQNAFIDLVLPIVGTRSR